jgi:membrane protein
VKLPLADRVNAPDSPVMRLRRRSDAARVWVERTILWRIWERLAENEFVDRSVALGAKAFVSFLPALIVVASFMPSSVRASILETITRRAGVNGSTTVKDAFATSDDVRRATGIVGLFFTFFYINSFTAALGRVYTRAWRRPAGGRASRYAVGAGWLVGVVAYFALIGGLRALLGGGPQTALFALVAWCAAIGVWWVTPWLMLHRHVRFRVLASSAALTGTGMVAYALSASLWMPRTVTENQHQFGFFGVALSLVTWLTGASLIIVVGACIAPVLAEDPGWIGRTVRGGDTSSVLAVGAPPSLPAPPTPPTLRSALGVRRNEDQQVDKVP